MMRLGESISWNETELFFESILHENRSVTDLLGANYSYLNDHWPADYGIPGVKAPHSGA